MSKLKIILAAIVGLLALVVVLQNTEAVQTRILFVSVTMPRAALLAGTFVLGFLSGLLLAGRVRRKGT